MDKLHFIIKEDGKLYVFRDLPQKKWTSNYPFEGFPKYAPSHSEIDEYEAALQRAKDNAILVDNPEVLPLSWVTTDTTTYFWKGEKMQEDTIYSLEGCEIRIDELPIPCPDGLPGCAVWHFQEYAVITFSEKKEEQMKKSKDKAAPKGSKNFTPGPKLSIYESADRWTREESVSITSEELIAFNQKKEDKPTPEPENLAIEMCGIATPKKKEEETQEAITEIIQSDAWFNKNEIQREIWVDVLLKFIMAKDRSALLNYLEEHFHITRK
jgi:hypothetical protein